MYCRFCGSSSNYKNGFIKGKQRYKCKGCGKNFLEKDGRTKESTIAKRALAVVLYTMLKATYDFLAKKVFNCSPTTVMNWIKQASADTKMPEISNDAEVEFDEILWHFICKKKSKNGFSKPLIVVQERLSPGLQAIVILQRLKSSTIK